MSDTTIQNKQMMSTPTAILVGGILISLAILYTQGDLPFISQNKKVSESTVADTPIQKILNLGKELKLDKKKFDECVNKNDSSEIDKDMAEVNAVTGGVGTPAFFIGEVDGNKLKNAMLIPGAFPYNVFSIIVDSYQQGKTNEIEQKILEEMNKSTTDANRIKSLADLNIQTNKEISFDDDPIKGNKDAKVGMIEFSDYECPFCKRHFTQTYPQVAKEYIDTGILKFSFRDYIAVPGHNPVATQAAVAANCAREQGGDEAYFKFHDAYFTRTNANGKGL